MPEESASAEKLVDKPLKGQKKVKTFLNKVVIRKLPPNLNSEDFLQITSPLPDYTDFYFVSADFSLGADATSRAYIEFKNQDDVTSMIENLFLMKKKVLIQNPIFCRFFCSRINLMNMFSLTASEDQNILP
jgi:hypothetical protein